MMRRLLLVLAPVILVILVLMGYLNYQHRYGQLSVKLPSGVKAVIYEQAGEDPEKTPQVASFTTNYSGKLKRAGYVIAIDGSPDYENKTLPVTVGGEPTKLDVDLAYSAPRLTKLLATESTPANLVLAKEYPNAIYNYSLGKGQLFKQGQWLGEILVANDGSDSLRVVLHKVNNQWTVATNPPSINLDKYSFPDVPLDILKAANDL